MPEAPHRLPRVSVLLPVTDAIRHKQFNPSHLLCRWQFAVQAQYRARQSSQPALMLAYTPHLLVAVVVGGCPGEPRRVILIHHAARRQRLRPPPPALALPQPGQANFGWRGEEDHTLQPGDKGVAPAVERAREHPAVLA